MVRRPAFEQPAVPFAAQLIANNESGVGKPGAMSRVRVGYATPLTDWIPCATKMPWVLDRLGCTMVMFSNMTCETFLPKMALLPVAVVKVVAPAPAPLMTRHGLPLNVTTPLVAAPPARHPCPAGAIPVTSIAPCKPGSVAVSDDKSNEPPSMLIR